MAEASEAGRIASRLRRSVSASESQCKRWRGFAVAVDWAIPLVGASAGISALLSPGAVTREKIFAVILGAAVTGLSTSRSWLDPKGKAQRACACKERLTTLESTIRLQIEGIAEEYRGLDLHRRDEAVRKYLQEQLTAIDGLIQECGSK